MCTFTNDYGTPWRSEDNLNCRASPSAYVKQRLFAPPTPPCLPGTLACELLGILLHPLPVSPEECWDCRCPGSMSIFYMGSRDSNSFPHQAIPPPVLYLTFSRHLRNAAGWFSVSMFSGLKHTDLFLKFFNASHSNPGH